jgi:hypothetical protein
LLILITPLLRLHSREKPSDFSPLCDGMYSDRNVEHYFASATIRRIVSNSSWVMGLCVLKNEHVVIDVLYNVFPPAVKRWISLINYFVVFIINSLFFYYSWIYVDKIGTHLSKGMMIPMSYYYTIMPVSCFICAICIVIKMVETIKAPAGFFNLDNNNVTE